MSGLYMFFIGFASGIVFAVLTVSVAILFNEFMTEWTFRHIVYRDGEEDADADAED